MSEKRYFLHKHLIKNDVIHDKICHRWLKGEELESDMNTLYEKYSSLKRENKQLKQQLFETSKELLWATSDEVDKALYYEDEVEELRKEIFE